MTNNKKNIVIIQQQYRDLELISQELEKYSNIYLYMTLSFDKAFRHIESSHNNKNKVDLVVVELDSENIKSDESISFIKNVKKRFSYIKIITNSNLENGFNQIEKTIKELEPDVFFSKITQTSDSYNLIIQKDVEYHREYAQTLYKTLNKDGELYLTEIEKNILQLLIKEGRLSEVEKKAGSLFNEKTLTLARINKIINELMERFFVKTKFQLALKAHSLGLIEDIEI